MKLIKWNVDIMSTVNHIQMRSYFYIASLLHCSLLCHFHNGFSDYMKARLTLRLIFGRFHPFSALFRLETAHVDLSRKRSFIPQEAAWGKNLSQHLKHLHVSILNSE